MQAGGFYFRRRFQDKFPDLFYRPPTPGKHTPKIQSNAGICGLPTPHRPCIGAIAFVIQEKVDELFVALRDGILCPMLWHI